jgi:hypothetical protein
MHSQKGSIKEHEVKTKPLAFSSVFQPPTPRVHHLSFDGKNCTPKKKKKSIIEKKKKGVLQNTKAQTYEMVQTFSMRDR